MGITQQPLINLVDAARDYEQALNQLIHLTKIGYEHDAHSIALASACELLRRRH